MAFPGQYSRASTVTTGENARNPRASENYKPSNAFSNAFSPVGAVVSSPNNGMHSNLGTSGSGPGSSPPSSVGSSLYVTEPKFKNLLDLERIVDKNQAESLRLIRLGHRERHRITVAPQEYFYRHLLVPKLLFTVLTQLLSSFILLWTWTYMANIVDVFFIHFHLRTENSFYVDLGTALSPLSTLNWWFMLGILLFSLAATVHYIIHMQVPPPVFHNRTQKLRAFMSTAGLGGPWILVYAGILSLRPSLLPAVEKIAHVERNETVESINEETLHHGYLWFWSDIVLWEVVLKGIMPMISIGLVILAANLIQFWRGDFYIGSLRPTTFNVRSMWIQFFRNPMLLYGEMKNLFVAFVMDRVLPLLAVPGSTFGLILCVLYFAPILFPVATMCRLWIHYHFLAFATLHAWILNLDIVKRSLIRAHNFGKLDFMDIVALPPVLKELRRTGWHWTEYFEMQLRNDILVRLRSTPNVLQDYLNTRMMTRDVNQLNVFIQFWLQPVRDYTHHLRTTKFLPAAQDEQWSMSLDFLFWTTSQLTLLFNAYSFLPDDPFLEYYDCSHYAALVRPSPIVMDNIRVVSQFLLRGKAVDSRSNLNTSFDLAVEQLAALGMVLETVDRNFHASHNADGQASLPELEPTIRFYIRAHTQLQSILPLHLRELLALTDSQAIDLRFQEFAGAKVYVEKLMRKSEERNI